MIEVLFYSIAGKKANESINAALEELSLLDSIPKKDKGILDRTLKVAEKGQYPEVSYYEMFYNRPEYVTNSKAEILESVDRIKDFYKGEWIKDNLLQAVNTSDSTEDLLEKTSGIISKISKSSSSDLDKFKPKSYSDYGDEEFTDGFKLGIPEIDSLTFGIQPGNMATIAAFTGGGKTTAMLSAAFKNVMEGRKGVIFSLEMAPELVVLQIQARYLYEVKGLEVTQQDLVMHKLPKDMAQKVKEYDADFKREVCSNLLIVDETVLNKALIKDSKLMGYLYDKFCSLLGGLDFICYDHAHQIELMYPDMGNVAIRTIMSACKTWVNPEGVKPITLLLAQVNREGYKRACKRDGVYSLDAIGDLNECERSSSYVIFLHTTDDSKIVQETKVTMPKHRLGEVLTEPAVVTFNPAVVLVGSNVESVTVDSSFNDVLSDFGADLDF